MDKDLEQWIAEFERLVRDKFSFLSPMGFTCAGLRRIDFDEPRDRSVEVSYQSTVLRVSVHYYILDADIDVGLIRLFDGQVPDKYSYFGDELGSAIGLSLLVEMITGGAVKRPLPETPWGPPYRKLTKAWRERAKRINEDFEGVIEEYSSLLIKYASHILAGDFSQFRQVQAYSRDKMKDFL